MLCHLNIIHLAVQYSKSTKPEEIILMIGQEQDSFGGGTELHQSFSGYVSFFGIWSSVLNVSMIEAIGDCEDNPAGDLLPWDINFWVKGDITLQNGSLESICQTDPLMGLFVEKEIGFNWGNEVCHRLKGTLNPTTDFETILQENDQYFNMRDLLDLTEYPSCLVQNGIHRWLGFSAKTQNEWTNVETSEVIDSKQFGN